MEMKYKKTNYIKIQFIFFNFLFLLFIINHIKADDCIITNNTEITRQWLNNIICIGDNNFRYVNFATFSNGDMIVETTAIPGSAKRKFYGIKSNGEPLFDNQQYFATIEVSNQHEPDNERYEGEIFIAVIGDKEYLVSVAKGDNRYTELYDFDDMIVKSQVLAINFLSANKILNIRGSSTNFIKDDINSVLFSFVDYNSGNQLGLKILQFSSTDIYSNNPVKKSTNVPDSIGLSVSCFITDSNFIICLYLTQRISIDLVDYISGKIKIGVFTTELSQKKEEDTNYIMMQFGEKINIFLKCIHLEGNAGVFIFYKASLGLTGYTLDSYPTILIKYYTGSSLNKYFSMDSISLNKKEFNTYCLLNDLIKISNQKICFISTSVNKEELIIVLLNVFDTNKIVIRYYSIAIFNLYTFKFLLETRASPYNNYISFAFCFCRQSECENKENPHYAGLMIFSYANGNDYTLNLTDYLFNNNEIKINDLQIDLKENVRIDNNIFGLIYSGIEIKQIINCENINLLSSLNENTNITINYTLLQNEKINVTFNSYNTFTCIIKYYYIITEPDFDEYNSYTTNRITDYGTDTAAIFNDNEKSEYKSKILTYSIILNNKLEKDECENRNCELCLESDKNYCITCMYNYSIIFENTIKYKTCYPNPAFQEVHTTQIIPTTIIHTTQIIPTTLIHTTQIIPTTLIHTTQIIPTTTIHTTQIIPTTAIHTTQIIPTTIIHTTQIKPTTTIHTTQIIPTTAIHTTQIIPTSLVKLDTTQIKETTIIKTETTQFIGTSHIQNNKIQTTQIIASETTQSIISTNIVNAKNVATTEIQADTTQLVNTEETNSDIKNNGEPEYCTNAQILNSKCEDKKMSSKQVSDLYNLIIDNVLKDDYNGDNKIIKTENVVFQVSKFEDQKNDDRPDVSSIDLGQCEDILKHKYNISKNDSLIILKTDIKSEDLSSTHVQYELYNPYTFQPLSLDVCSNIKIAINVPVKLDDTTVTLYNSLSESGYNLFDSEDDFYNDICSTYTSVDGTDMTLEDRKKEIFGSTENITMCQSGCTFESYNVTTKKAKCNCEVQIESTLTDIKKIDFSNKNFINSFVDTLIDSNFLVMKCYKLVLTLKDFFKNKGRIIMTIILLLFLALLLFYIIKDNKKINDYIKNILNIKNTFNTNTNKLKEKTKQNEQKKIKKINNSKNKKDLKDTKKGQKNKTKNNNFLNNKKSKNSKNKKNNKKKELKKSHPPKKKEIKHNKEKNKKLKYSSDNNKIINSKVLNSRENLMNSMNKKININIIPITKIEVKKANKKELNIFENKNKKEDKLFVNKKVNINPKSNKNNICIIENYEIKTDVKNNNKKKINNNSFKNLNDQELNTMEYNYAILYDKRTYLEYYWSLLKKKQLILFTFLPTNDYNLLSLKIALFLLSFSLYFTINGFFFNDETMHKIHEDKGSFNILVQIPQIFYSSVVSAVINMILKMLSLSEKNILALKHEKNINNIKRIANQIKKCILIKFISFFVISNLLLLFFWYFISCFCAVYTNTQDILIEDTMFSFLLSLLYPFGLNLLPGIFRIPALRAKKKDKKCLYQFSSLIALI